MQMIGRYSTSFVHVICEDLLSFQPHVKSSILCVEKILYQYINGVLLTSVEALHVS